VPEDHGGSGFGYVGLGQVMEAAGRSLAATPLLGTALVGAVAIDKGGSEAQKSEHFPGLVGGETIFALALEEHPHHRPYWINTSAQKSGSGWVLNGAKQFVLDGHVADTLIVVARTSGEEGGRNGITLFLVPGNAAGVSRKRSIMVDSRNAARITLENVAVGPEAVLGHVDGGADLLDAILDAARAGLAAEMLGSSSEAFERTVQYLKDRKQFGVPIGSFQALKHRAAHMYCEVEATRSAVTAALDALDTGANDASLLVSLAKCKANQTARLTGDEGIQMHGGIGMTDAHDAGFYLKRARAAEAAFGSQSYHRDRYARINGY
jgi:alkylation response protein AidB-like acyl-CoA dehydrogenase